MLIESLKTLFNQDLKQLKNKSDIWKIQLGIANSAGKLGLHLMGNLNAYIVPNLERLDISETNT